MHHQDEGQPASAVRPWPHTFPSRKAFQVSWNGSPILQKIPRIFRGSCAEAARKRCGRDGCFLWPTAADVASVYLIKGTTTTKSEIKVKSNYPGIKLKLKLKLRWGKHRGSHFYASHV